MQKICGYIENAVLESVEPTSDTPPPNWERRKDYVGLQGEIVVCKSENKYPGKHFISFFGIIALTVIDESTQTIHNGGIRTFKLTTGCGDIEQTETHLKIITKNSIYTFRLNPDDEIDEQDSFEGLLQ